MSLAPLNRKEAVRQLLVEIPESILSAVEKEAERLGVTKKDATLFGLKSFLLIHNPKEAAKLGIENEE